jgi:prefoldin subunit 5
VNYCKFLVSLEKTDQAIEILEKRRRELEKKEVKSVSLDRFLKYLQSK